MIRACIFNLDGVIGDPKVLHEAHLVIPGFERLRWRDMSEWVEEVEFGSTELEI